MGNITFDCCINCQNRYPGCHDHCAAYLSRWICREAELEAVRQERKISGVLYEQRTAAVTRATRKRKKRGRQYGI